MLNNAPKLHYIIGKGKQANQKYWGSQDSSLQTCPLFAYPMQIVSKEKRSINVDFSKNDEF